MVNDHRCYPWPEGADSWQPSQAVVRLFGLASASPYLAVPRERGRYHPSHHSAAGVQRCESQAVPSGTPGEAVRHTVWRLA